jgi:membrane protease YdiL (CAAX protease family)
MRSRVRVERETCETCGAMDSNLAATDVAAPSKPFFPYSNWGPLAAILGVFLALGTGIVFGIPAIAIDHPENGDLSDWANAFVQLGTAAGFLMVPMLIAARRGASSIGEAAERLGVRRFRPSALKWMAAAVGAYLLFAIVYALALGEPHQEDVADKLGAIPVQVFLIVVAAPISEEVCFRGMLFGGLRERWPRTVAALLSAIIFGGLHATTGVTAVPPLIFFGFALALLYEKTGSVVPGILLHMLNNSVALLGQ